MTCLSFQDDVSSIGRGTSPDSAVHSDDGNAEMDMDDVEEEEAEETVEKAVEMAEEKKDEEKTEEAETRSAHDEVRSLEKKLKTRTSNKIGQKHQKDFHMETGITLDNH